MKFARNLNNRLFNFFRYPMKNIIKTILFLVPVLFISEKVQALTVESVRCEFREDPSSVESPNPRFGWILSSDLQGDKQTAYEIQTASNSDLLKANNPDYWNTGKVISDKSQYIVYGGRSLKSKTNYYWRIRVWDKNGNVSAWSSIGTWSSALKETDFEARWIGAIHQKDTRLPKGNNYHTLDLPPGADALWENVHPSAKRSIMLRKEFTLTGDIADAAIYVCGLGHYDLYVNGNRIGTEVFKPLWSDYKKTIYYNTFDIKPYLKKGKNVIGVMLGNGMYNVAGGRYTKFRVSFGPPTLFLQADISCENGKSRRIVSDESWKYDVSPITFNCISGGEDYDARLEQHGWDSPGFNDNKWVPVVLQEPPGGKLTAQSAPAIKILNRYGVKEFKELTPGQYLFDLGQNLSGFPTIKVRGKKGDKIRLVPGEILNAKKTRIEQENSGSPYYFEYTLKGTGIEEWTPRFSYYGYQYIQVENINYLEEKDRSLPTLLDITSDFVSSSGEDNGLFECSNELFNRIHFIIGQASRSNMQSVLTDCPHREKLGWLEEYHLNAPGLLFNYDLRTLFPKIMQDIEDTQCENGLIPDIAPEYVQFVDGFRDSPEWGVAGVIVPWMYYEWYGDDALIREYYSVMKRYTDYLRSKSQDYILTHGLGDWYDYGPEPAGISQNTPPGITATSHFYMAAYYTSKAATLLGNLNDEKKYSDLAKNISEAFNANFFDPSTKQYGNGSQCSNAIPLFLNIVPSEYTSCVLKNLLNDIKIKGYKLSTGDVGNRYLYQTLADNGFNDVLYKMHNHKDVPGYGFQIELGVTTLTEQWDPRKGMSWNHFMMGQIEEWFYKSLAGIKPDMNAPGFKHFFIEPAPVGDLTFVNASYMSMYGLIESKWKIENNRFEIQITVPVNTTATLKLPGREKKVVKLDSGKHVVSTAL